MRVKNWEQFQHYRNRKPPWIRLYRDLLDDDDFAELPDSAVRHLVMFWLIASEDSELTGNLPSIKKLAFRLRTTAQKVKRSISQLSHYLEDDASTVLSGCLHDATPETETETEEMRDRGETEVCATDFDLFWQVYPKRKGRLAAEKAFAKAARGSRWPGIGTIINTVEAQIQSDDWQKNNGQFIPLPTTWLNQGRWMDEGVKTALDQYLEQIQADIDAENGVVVDVEFKETEHGGIK